MAHAAGAGVQAVGSLAKSTVTLFSSLVSLAKSKENIGEVALTDYRCTDEIEKLVKRKHGEDIFVVGTPLDEIREFWRHVGYKAEGTIGEPQEISKTVVDIDCKSHGNYAVEEGADANSHDKDKPKDWYDEFQITSKKAKEDSNSKSYNVQSSTRKGFQIGGNAGLKADAGFFNVAGGGVAPELGINAAYHKETTTTATLGETDASKLSQGYEMVDKVHVPPKKMVEAMITTWAVTYEAKTTLVYTVEANITLPVRYRTHLSRVLGGYLLSTAYIPARDIFEDETGFEIVNGDVKFTRDGKVSYISEQVEIKKKKKDL